MRTCMKVRVPTFVGDCYTRISTLGFSYSDARLYRICSIMPNV